MVSRRIFTFAVSTAAIVLATYALAAGPVASRVSVASDGGQGNGPSYFGVAGPSARFVVFSSDATNLVPGDTNAKTDVFRHDRATGETVRVSVNDGGVQADGRSFASDVSRDGRLVLFWSHATNLVPGDTNGQSDVFLRDMVVGSTRRISMGMDGVQTNGGNRYPSMSDDGRWIAFQSWATNIVPGETDDHDDIVLHDRRTGQTTRVVPMPFGDPNDGCLHPSLSPNGRYLAFESQATNLVSGDFNATMDAFVVDRTRGTVVRASVSSEGVEGNAESRVPFVTNNGRVLFSSAASNLVPGDSNQAYEPFVHDLRRGETIRVAVSSDEAEGNYGSARGTIDPKGRWVAFGSTASNLVPGDGNGVLDVFLRDLARGTTVRLSASHDGGESNGASHGVAFMGGGTLLVSSVATNLVPNDTNATDDLFVLRWR